MDESRKPMTPVEVHNFLKEELHGPPPQKTLYRIYATLADWRDQLILLRDDIREAERRHIEEMRGYARELLELRGLYAVACVRLQQLGEETVPLTEAPGGKKVPDVVHRCSACDDGFGFTMYVASVPTAGPLGSYVNVFWCRKCGRLLVGNPDFIKLGCSEKEADEYFGRVKQFFDDMLAVERDKRLTRKQFQARVKERLPEKFQEAVNPVLQAAAYVRDKWAQIEKNGS